MSVEYIILDNTHSLWHITQKLTCPPKICSLQQPLSRGSFQQPLSSNSLQQPLASSFQQPVVCSFQQPLSSSSFQQSLGSTFQQPVVCSFQQPLSSSLQQPRKQSPAAAGQQPLVSGLQQPLISTVCYPMIPSTISSYLKHEGSDMMMVQYKLTGRLLQPIMIFLSLQGESIRERFNHLLAI